MCTITPQSARQKAKEQSIILAMDYMLFALLGLILGSFATALAARAQEGRIVSMLGGRSACPKCGKCLGVRDLIPLLSWLILKGRCRMCGAAISPTYLLTETACGVLAVAIYAVHGMTLEAFFLMAALPFLVALFVVDVRIYLLPNALIIPLVLLGLWRTPEITALISAVIYGGLPFIVGCVLAKILKKDALGFGDVKFCGVAGLWLGIDLLPLFFILSGTLGVAFGLLWRWTGRGAVFPFGPALIIALIALLLVPIEF